MEKFTRCDLKFQPTKSQGYYQLNFQKMFSLKQRHYLIYMYI